MQLSKRRAEREVGDWKEKYLRCAGVLSLRSDSLTPGHSFRRAKAELERYRSGMGTLRTVDR